MKAAELKVGDRVRILGCKCSLADQETKLAWERLAERGRSVRISAIDDYGTPWYECRLKIGGKWEYHFLTVRDDDNNWASVKKRKIKN